MWGVPPNPILGRKEMITYELNEMVPPYEKYCGSAVEVYTYYIKLKHLVSIPKWVELGYATRTIKEQIGNWGANYYVHLTDVIVVQFDEWTEEIGDYISQLEDCCQYWEYQELLTIGREVPKAIVAKFDDRYATYPNGIRTRIGSNPIVFYGYNDAKKAFVRVVGNSIYEVITLTDKGWKHNKELSKEFRWEDFGGFCEFEWSNGQQPA